MLLKLGNDFFEAKKGRLVPITADTKKLINAHILMLGSSGVGKSYTIRDLIAQGAAQSLPRAGGSDSVGVRFHVMDVHGDLRAANASEVIFSRQVPYGLNPLRVNPDFHFGGPETCIENFIRTVNLASQTRLGDKQESYITKLLLDVYHDFGFYESDASTWSINELDVRAVSSGSDNRIYLEVPFPEKDAASALGARFDGTKRLWYIQAERYKGDITKWKPAFKARRYPTLDDVIEYAERIYDQRLLGSDQRAVRALDAVHKKAQAWTRKLLQAVKLERYESMQAEMESDLEEARKEAIETHTQYVNSVRTGHEFDNFKKYPSTETLQSVINRLGNLKSTGLFKNSPPPFDDKLPVWRYNLKAYSAEGKKMMVFFLMQEIFDRAVQRGEQEDVVEIVILDELGVYTSAADNEGGAGIIGVIAREARKFGLALWAATQTPDNVPISLISSVGTKIILGLDEGFWDAAVRKLRIEMRLLDWIQPKRTIAVQMKEAGANKNRWWWVQLLGKED